MDSLYRFPGLVSLLEIERSYQEPWGATGTRLRPMEAIILGHYLGIKSPQTKPVYCGLRWFCPVILRVLSLCWKVWGLSTPLNGLSLGRYFFFKVRLIEARLIVHFPRLSDANLPPKGPKNCFFFYAFNGPLMAPLELLWHRCNIAR